MKCWPAINGGVYDLLSVVSSEGGPDVVQTVAHKGQDGAVIRIRSFSLEITDISLFIVVLCF